jgi:hypothetical protein
MADEMLGPEWPIVRVEVVRADEARRSKEG